MKSTSNTTEHFHLLLKDFLKVAFLLTQSQQSFNLEDFAGKLSRTIEEAKALLSVLISLNMVKLVGKASGNYQITIGGRNNLRIVMTGGAFDILHLGHLKTLQAAKTHGDLLFVVVASDQTVERNKGRPPMNSQNNRMALLSHIDIIDKVVAGASDPEKFIETVGLIQPDVIALGYDQSLSEERLLKMLHDKGETNIEIIRLEANVPDEKTSLKMQSIDDHSFD
ncbi:MAG: adenylyltransferase/cytidyltransferase family protein [Candidatus Heimdallarchaeota archaeon]